MRKISTTKIIKTDRSWKLKVKSSTWETLEIIEIHNDGLYTPEEQPRVTIPDEALPDLIDYLQRHMKARNRK